jgi:hypothetical protein
MTQDQYIENFLWKRIDTDNYPRRWKYQCVDLFKHYMFNVYGIKLGKVGNANNIYFNRYKPFGKWWKRYSIHEPMKKWDIIITTYGKYWHITIVREDLWNKVLVLEQNGVGGGNWLWVNSIRLKEYNKSFWRWFRRLEV